jgi:hypothetical protein
MAGPRIAGPDVPGPRIAGSRIAEPDIVDPRNAGPGIGGPGIVGLRLAWFFGRGSSGAIDGLCRRGGGTVGTRSAGSLRPGGGADAFCLNG